MDKLNRLTRKDEWKVGARYRWTKGRASKLVGSVALPSEVTFLGWHHTGRRQLAGYAILRHADGSQVVSGPGCWRNHWVLVQAPEPLPPIVDAADLLKEPATKTLDQLQRRKPSGKIVFNRRNNTATLRYAYPYEIDLDEIRTERDLLAWALHLCQKNWIDTERLHEAVTAIGTHKGFSLHGLQGSTRHGSEVTQDWPRITVNLAPGEVREWIHDVPPRYFLYRNPDNSKLGDRAGKWEVCDRVYDLPATKPYTRKADCIRAFVRQYDLRFTTRR